MNSTTFFLDALRKKGIDFVLIGAAIWYVVLENQEVRKEAQNCTQARIAYMESQNALMLEIVNKNTIAIEKILEKF